MIGKIVPMSIEYAKEIITWQYEGQYSIYNVSNNVKDVKQLLPSESLFSYVALTNHNELLGFYEFTYDGTSYEIGNGLKPSLTGKGIGQEFVEAGVRFLIQLKDLSDCYIKLRVRPFNKRAQIVYERVGFKVTSIDDEWVWMALKVI